MEITLLTPKVEQATITYDLGNGFSITAGKMLTYMGFEAYDPTNMYQYSYAYDFRKPEQPVKPKPYMTHMMLGFPLIM